MGRNLIGEEEEKGFPSRKNNMNWEKHMGIINRIKFTIRNWNL